MSTSSQTRFAMKSVFFIAQSNTFHQQGITGLLFVRRFLLQSLFLKENNVGMKLRRWFAVLTRYYR
ncbi:TPA: adenine methyltransferase [Escherichia coli]|uniref:adenine methyltransferase n=2 Tax=Escherichia coli TaxID=562 RepID=UPI00207BCB8A|nr:adenine methyltransferase [Escherichia coli]MCA7512736.1 adenine methyltransferase [Escherichia coli]